MSQVETNPQLHELEDMITFEATSVTSNEAIEVSFQRTAPAEAVARSLAHMLNMPTDSPYGLREDTESVYLDARPIGEQLEPGARVTLTPKSHLG